MDIRRFSLGEKVSAINLGLYTTVFLVGFVGVIVLPFYLYLFGAGVFWEFLGIAVCMLVIWNLEAYRLMRYAKNNKDIMSIPGYFTKRFRDHRWFMRMLVSVEIIILSLVIMALITKEMTLVFNTIFGQPFRYMSLAVVVVVAIALGLFGIEYIYKSAVYKAVIIMITVISVFIYMFSQLGIYQLVKNIMSTLVTGSVSEYMNILYHNGKMLEVSDLISLASMGTLSSGMPFILNSFFAVDNSKKISTGKKIMVVYILPFFIGAAGMGGISRGYLYPEAVTRSLSEYIKLVFLSLKNSGGVGNVIAYLYIISIFIAFISAIEGSLNAVSTVILEDIVNKGRVVHIRKKNEPKVIVWCCIFVGVAVVLLSEIIGSFSISTITVFIGTMGCSISPVVFMSLVWKRMNKYGCIAGLVSGLVSVPLFKYALLFGGESGRITLCDLLGVNSVVPSIIVSFSMIILFSLITPDVSKKAKDEFMNVRNRIEQ